MTNPTRTPQQLDPTTNPSNNNEARTNLTQSNTVPIKTQSVPLATRPQTCNYQTSEPARKDNIPFAMERYLGETPNAGGAIYDLTHRPGPRDILSVLVLVDMEFGEGKSPSWYTGL